MKNIFRSVYFFCLFLSSFIPVVFIHQEASAQITADKTIFFWEKDLPPVRNVSVRNSSDRPLLVGVQVQEVLRPGQADQERIPSEEILVSPRRFSVPGKGQRTARILLRGARTDTERVFRISFVPQARFDGDDEEEEKKSTERITTVLKVLTGVGMLIFVEPNEKTERLTIDKSESVVVLRNDGNINILIDRLRSCTPNGDECVDIQPKRLYPTNFIEVPRLSGGQISFRKRIGIRASEETVD